MNDLDLGGFWQDEHDLALDLMTRMEHGAKVLFLCREITVVIILVR